MENTEYKEIIGRCAELERKVDRVLAVLEQLKSRQNIIGGEVMHDFHDLCHILHISVRQVRRYCTSGELPGFKIGKRRFWPDSEVQAFIRRKKKENGRSSTQ